MFTYDPQTAKELEFDKIKELLLGYCVAETSQKTVEQLKPYQTLKEVDRELGLTDEMKTIKNHPEGGFPRIDFEDLTPEIKKLRIEGYILPLEAFVKLLRNSRLCNELIEYMEEREGMYPHMEMIFKRAGNSDIIIKSIEEVFDAKMHIKNDASPELFQIRTSIRITKREINKNFDQVLKKLLDKGYLGDTKETFINDRRVLTVVSNYKRKIPGNNLGTSKTGGLSYIEPQVNEHLNRDLDSLFVQERDEILRILKVLTKKIKKELPLIKACQKLLNRLDFIQAKFRLATSINGIKPKSSEETIIDMIDAIHPLLYLNNKKDGKKTFPQSVVMDKASHFLVISGPNAGGKSITLKTIGLLQLMWQSGLMVPVHHNSTFGWFEQVLSDIGDNQSIENQLSTYSYRLNRMNYFLKEANPTSMLLLDEFGSGSDPELGGALAEAIFESLYKKKTFAILTTHYANIKLKASSLGKAINACMLFDRETLAPSFMLSIGQPGSSFTFEVAKMNGIPDHILANAKQKLSKERVQMDQLIATLQKEKSTYERRNQSLKDKEFYSSQMKDEFEDRIAEVKEQKQSQREVIQKNNQHIIAGKKMAQFVKQFEGGRANKGLLTEVKKYLAIEKSKIDQVDEKQVLKSKRQGQKKLKNTSVTLSDLKKERGNSITPQRPIDIGDKVRIKTTKQKGVVESIEKNKVFVIVGNFMIQSRLSDLDLIG
jgi:DNA mismatch repair protein MutS2